MEEFLLAMEMGGRSGSTLRVYRRVLERWEAGGVEALFGSSRAPETERVYWTVLQRFWRWARERGVEMESPVAQIPKPRAPEAPPRAIPAGVLEKLGTALREEPLLWRALFTLILELGLRESEAASLRVRDVDFSTRGAESVRIRGKGRKERILPLPAGYESRPLLRRLIQGKAPEEFVFAVRGERPPSPSGIWRAWRRLCERAGVEPVRVHDLRHTAATRMLERTHDLQLVSRMLGHSSVAVTARYTMRSDAAFREAMDKKGGGWRR